MSCKRDPRIGGLRTRALINQQLKLFCLFFFVEGDVDSRWPAVSDLDKIKKKKQQIGDRKGESGGQT